MSWCSGLEGNQYRLRASACATHVKEERDVRARLSHMLAAARREMRPDHLTRQRKKFRRADSYNPLRLRMDRRNSQSTLRNSRGTPAGAHNEGRVVKRGGFGMSLRGSYAGIMS